MAYDGTASIDLIPDTGYHAAYILDNGVPVTVADPYVINNVTEDHDVVVFFEIDTYTIAASVDPVGKGSVSGAGDYQYGSTCTLTATPDAGWSFVDWTEGGGRRYPPTPPTPSPSPAPRDPGGHTSPTPGSTPSRPGTSPHPAR